MGSDLFQKLADKYPFITLCVYSTNEYVGIVQNRDDVITTIYDFGIIQDPEQKRRYIDLANTWWWESNRSIPINIFLRGEWEEFRLCLRTFVNKDLEILHGPVCSLNDIAIERANENQSPWSGVLIRFICNATNAA
jgi:hypothetical protein